MNDIAAPDSMAESVLSGYRLLRETCGRVNVGGRHAVVLTGEDRKGWLQGQATNDLRHLGPGSYIPFCLCSATGQIEGIYGLWGLPDRLILTAEKQAVDVLLHRVEKMVILEEVHASVDEYAIISLQGPQATDRLQEFVPNLPSLNSGEGEIDGEEVIVLRSNRTGFGGWACLARTGGAAQAKLEAAFPLVDDLAFQIARLEAGIPVYGVDTNSRTLPPELGSAFENSHVNYKKGCYMGQEVLMRLHSRGHTNQTWMGIFCDGPVAAGDKLSHPRRPEAGEITSAYESPEFGWIAGAYVRREVAYTGEIVTIRSASGEVQGEVQEMPLLRLE